MPINLRLFFFFLSVHREEVYLEKVPCIYSTVVNNVFALVCANIYVFLQGDRMSSFKANFLLLKPLLFTEATVYPV